MGSPDLPSTLERVAKPTYSLAIIAVTIATVLALSACAAQRDPFPPAAAGTLPAPSQTPATATESSTPSDTPLATPTPTMVPTSVAFDKKARSISDPTSYWVVVDKLRPFNPKNYAPGDLVTLPVHATQTPIMRKTPGNALIQMFNASKAEGAGQLQVISPYRSYNTQVAVYANQVKVYGKATADTQSARPGFSEHQSGLSVDIGAYPSKCNLGECFGTTPQGKWLAKNSWRFGFILRYPQGKQAISGFKYEPWHYRFVGVQLSTQMHNTHIQTLEEFFGLPPAPNYAN
jgi:D-alanyl-D-alanine carboxypeptidase